MSWFQVGGGREDVVWIDARQSGEEEEEAFKGKHLQGVIKCGVKCEEETDELRLCIYTLF